MADGVLGVGKEDVIRQNPRIFAETDDNSHVMKGMGMEKLYIQRRSLRKDVQELEQTLQEILEHCSHNIPALQRKLQNFVQRVREKKTRLETLDKRIESIILSDTSEDMKTLHEEEYRKCQSYMDKITDILLRTEILMKQPTVSRTRFGKTQGCYKDPDDFIPDVITSSELKKLYIQRRPLRQYVRGMSETLRGIVEEFNKEENVEGLKKELRIFNQKAQEKKADLKILDKEICDIITSDEQEEILSLFTEEVRVSEIYTDKFTRVMIEVEDLLERLPSLRQEKQKEIHEINLDQEHPQQSSVVRLPEKILQKSSKVWDTNKKVDVYTPQQKRPIVQGEVEKYEIGMPNNYTYGERTIMVLGATGTGKTTFINSMINYLFEVDFSDTFRFKLITQDDEGKESAQSITKKVTAYVLHETRLPYLLTVVDTPGYGDTDGIKADKHTTGLIKHLFESTDESGIKYLDAIVLVVKASDTRLTAHQKHNFNSVFQLFGKDLEDNIIAVATFSDSNDPPVKQTLRDQKINFKSFHKFNNSAFFAGPKTDKDEQVAQYFYWKVGQQGFEDFFKTVESMHTKSLSQSAEVLRKRVELENTVQQLKQLVQIGITHLEQMRQEAMILENHNAVIAANEGFEYIVEEEKWVSRETPPGQYTTNCMICNRTCHENCNYSNDADKDWCVAMDNEGNCKHCPEKCSWTCHRNLPYLYVLETNAVKKTNEELRQKWTKAQEEKTNVEAMLQTLGQELAKEQEKVLGTIKQINDAAKKLSEIAHYPRFITNVQFIENMIEEEKSEMKPGYENRIAHLTCERDLAVTMEQAEDPNFDPFAHYRDGKWNTFIEDFNKKYYQRKTTTKLAISNTNRRQNYFQGTKEFARGVWRVVRGK